MHLTFKDLQQKKFTIEAEPSATILEVKQKIHESQGHDVEAQKLIYSGKILQDDQTVEYYKIQEKDFVPKPAAPAPAAKSSTPTPTAAPPAYSATNPPAPQPGAVPAPSTPATTVAASPPPPPQPAAAPSFNDPNAFSVGAAREGAIQELMMMGFERTDVERAMRAAFNNPDRAVEYLMDGIPAHLQTETAPRPTAQSPATPSPAPPQATVQQPVPQQPATAPPPSNAPVNLFEAAAQHAAAQRGGGGIGRPAATSPPVTTQAGTQGAAPSGNVLPGGALDPLRNNPQFQQLRQLVQNNPQLLEPIIQNIAQGNPQFAALINQNPEGFLQLLMETAAGEGEEGGALPPGAIQVTPEEAEAIGRLEALGFPRHMAIQAYIACDKNEEIAANYLFEHGFDDDDDDEETPPS